VDSFTKRFLVVRQREKQNSQTLPKSIKFFDSSSETQTSSIIMKQKQPNERQKKITENLSFQPSNEELITEEKEGEEEEEVYSHLRLM
jgi:hypothetical protein